MSRKRKAKVAYTDEVGAPEKQGWAITERLYISRR